MRAHSINRIVIVLLTASAAPAFAERDLTLDEALDLARKSSRDLRQARARVDQTRVGEEEALVSLLPQVTAQGKYTHNYKEVVLDLSATNQGFVGLADATIASGVPNPAPLNAYLGALAAQNVQNPVIQKGEQLDGVLAATVPLVVPSAYPALSSAKRSTESAEATYRSTEADTLLRVAQAFYAAAGTDELLTARRNAVEVARKTLEDARVRVEVGVVNRVEVTRAQSALERAEQAEVEAGEQRAQAYRNLATSIHVDEPLRVRAAPMTATESAAPSQQVEQALRLRPELRAADLQVVAADGTISSNKWKWAPQLSAFGNVRAFNYVGFSGDHFAWAVGAQLDWTLYDGGLRDASRHLAEAQRREIEARLDLLRDTVRDEVLNARGTLATRRRGLATAERAVELARETMALLRAQYAAGTVKQLDVLAAQDQLVAADVDLARARFDLALAEIQLKRAEGTFPSAALAAR